MKPKFNFALAGGILALSLFAIVIFRTAKEISLYSYIAVIAAYSVITLCAAIWYILTNRGLAGVKISEDMLPKDWSGKEKDAFMNDLLERRQKSKKALVILVPMIANFFFEVLDIYLLRGILSQIIK